MCGVRTVILLDFLIFDLLTVIFVILSILTSEDLSALAEAQDGLPQFFRNYSK